MKRLVTSGISLLLGAVPVLWGAPLKLVREVDLRSFIQDSEEWLPSSHSVRQVAFSEDGNWVAATVGVHVKRGASRPLGTGETMSHLLVVPVSAGKQTLERDCPGMSYPTARLNWAPGAKAVLVTCGATLFVFPIADGQLQAAMPSDFRTSQPFGLADPEHWIAFAPPSKTDEAQGFRGPRRLAIFDLLGHLTEMWIKQPSGWAMQDANPQRRLAVFQVDARREGGGLGTVVLEYPTRRVRHEWPKGPFWHSYFAEAGKTVCSINSYGRDALPARCFDVDRGDKIAEFTGFNGGLPEGGMPVAISTSGSRIVLTDIQFRPSADGESDTVSFKDRVVWDFRSNTVVGEWTPRLQGYEEPGSKVDGEQRWGPCAISADGRYLVEGVSGVLRIYQLP